MFHFKFALNIGSVFPYRTFLSDFDFFFHRPYWINLSLHTDQVEKPSSFLKLEEKKDNRDEKLVMVHPWLLWCGSLRQKYSERSSKCAELVERRVNIQEKWRGSKELNLLWCRRSKEGKGSGFISCSPSELPLPTVPLHIYKPSIHPYVRTYSSYSFCLLGRLPWQLNQEMLFFLYFFLFFSFWKKN